MMAFIGTAYIGMAHTVVARIVTAYTFMAGRPVPLPDGHITKPSPRGMPAPLHGGPGQNLKGHAYIATAYTVVAYVVIAYIIMIYIVMAYI